MAGRCAVVSQSFTCRNEPSAFSTAFVRRLDFKTPINRQGLENNDDRERISRRDSEEVLRVGLHGKSGTKYSVFLKKLIERNHGSTYYTLLTVLSVDPVAKNCQEKTSGT